MEKIPSEIMTQVAGYFQVLSEPTRLHILNLLQEGERSVGEIAQRCGYNDSSFFIKQFRKYKNTTPKQYRTAEQNKEESA